MSIVKIAVSVMIDESPIWSLALETSQKAARRLGMDEYTKVVRGAEAELKTQIMKQDRQEKKDADKKSE